MHLWWIMLSQKHQSKWKSETLSRFSFSGVNAALGDWGEADLAQLTVLCGWWKILFFCLFQRSLMFHNTVCFWCGVKSKGSVTAARVQELVFAIWDHQVPPFHQFCSVKLSFPGRKIWKTGLLEARKEDSQDIAVNAQEAVPQLGIIINQSKYSCEKPFRAAPL